MAMNKFKLALLVSSTAFGGALLALLLFSFIDHKKPSSEADEHYSKEIQKNYHVFTLPLPESASFAGENVPLDQFDVRERFDRELLVNTYWQSNTLLGIKRAYRWFPVIEPILKANGVPDDFKYLALIESNLTNVVSPSGATGFWQFLEGTGKEFGLIINDEVDERYHVEKSTQAACAYLKKAYDRYGSWALVAASYNMGMGGIDRQVEKQRSKNYWDLLLNEETARYVFRMLAVKEIYNNCSKYGFTLRPSDLYAPLSTNTVVLDSTVNDFADYAAKLDINYKTLKLYNPWLRQASLKNKDRIQYEIKVPAK